MKATKTDSMLCLGYFEKEYLYFSFVRQSSQFVKFVKIIALHKVWVLENQGKDRKLEGQLIAKVTYDQAQTPNSIQ